MKLEVTVASGKAIYLDPVLIKLEVECHFGANNLLNIATFTASYAKQGPLVKFKSKFKAKGT
jgi:hypothetical protein